MNQPLAGLANARHRLARLRNQLHDELSKLKSGSTIYKTTKGRMGGVMDAIEICDQELLAQEQGPVVGHFYEPEIPRKMAAYPASLAGADAYETKRGEPTELRPDQVAWLNERRGE